MSIRTDLFVYGSTPAGVAAAIQGARDGYQVVLACPRLHVGGMEASGLCTMDAVRRNLFGGLVREFISQVRQFYETTLGLNHPDFALCEDGWHHEPSVAEAVMTQMVVAESRIRLMLGWALVGCSGEGRHISRVDLAQSSSSESQTPTTITARYFVDASYEGDLMAAAGVPFRVGREGRDEYGESLAGIVFMDWKSGRLLEKPMSGDASVAIQAYCYRCILTDDTDFRVPITAPDTYEAHEPDLMGLVRDFASGRVRTWSDIFMGSWMPNRKREVNGHIEALTSLNCPGANFDYPTASLERRRWIEDYHRDHAASLLWFLQHDQHVPEDLQREVRQFGLDAREFPDTAHWPWQLYVRQGRRMQGRTVVTQHAFFPAGGTNMIRQVARPIATAEHSFDIHPCQDRRFAVDGWAEGVLWYPDKANGPARPAAIPLEALLPREYDNLTVPVAVSCTHVAMSVIRMEPVWMTLGQVAGRLLRLSDEQGVAPAEVDSTGLADRLGIKLVDA